MKAPRGARGIRAGGRGTVQLRRAHINLDGGDLHFAEQDAVLRHLRFEWLAADAMRAVSVRRFMRASRTNAAVSLD